MFPYMFNTKNITYLGIAVGILLLFYFMNKKNNSGEQMGIQKSTLDFISREEGREHRSYKDIAGLDTTGVGHLIKPDEKHLIGKILSENEIDALLKKDLQDTLNSVMSNVKVKMTQNMFDAIMSLVFNIGGSNFKNSTVLKYINSSQPADKIIPAWRSWNKITKNGKKEMSDSLTKRRDRELNLYLS